MELKISNSMRERIKDLEARLADAEELIAAIKAGEVDAFAVGTAGESEVYTLQSGDYAYRILIEKFGEGAVNLTAEGLIVYTNAYFCELLDVTYETVVGSFIQDYMQSDFLEKFNSLLAQAKEGNSKGEINLIAGDKVIPVYISLTSLRPKLDSIGMIVTDLTEKKNHEKVVLNYQHELEQQNLQLDERNRFVEKLINSSPDLVMVVDEELRSITLNTKAESVLQMYLKGPVLNSKVTDILPWLAENQTRLDIRKAFEGKVVSGREIKDELSGNYYENNYIPLTNEKGQVYAVVIICHDITENKKQLDELLKLSVSDKLKSDFIKMASHELNTPVTSIKGYVQLLLSLFTETKSETKVTPETIAGALIKIDKQVLRLVRFISELLDLSRIEEGQFEIQKQIFDLNELVEETIQDIMITHPQQKINYRSSFNCKVDADKDRIAQVLSNIIMNAVKYSPHSKNIDISIHSLSQGKVGIGVKDYGIGINKADLEKIFERFYRSRDNKEETFPGFGVGLFVSKEIVEKHGGSITVKSEIGKGSTFTIILPVYSN